MEWYTQTSEQIYAHFESNELGLSKEQATKKREEHGENKLPEARKITYLEIFFRQFQSPLIYVLLIASVVVLVMGDIGSSIFIGAVLCINAIIGTFQEGKAQNTLVALKHLVDTQATILRSGVEVIVKDEELVPGDVVLLKEGDKIPADARIINFEQFAVDESSISGESEPIRKKAGTIIGNNLSVQDQNNMVFRGTYVVGGKAKVIVVATGVDTFIGKISVKLKTLDTDVPLKAEIKSFSNILIIIVCVIVILVFFLGIYSGIAGREMFSIAVAIAVSAVPEGLPVVVTLILATGVARMSKRNALVKNLQSVEALGQADVIAVDKTGTITMNQMMVKEVYIASGLYAVTGQGYEPKGIIKQADAQVDYTSRADLMLMGKISSLTATAHIAYKEENNFWQRISGDPTEVALLVFAQKLGLNKFVIEAENPKLIEMPFNSNTSFHATLNQVHGGRNTLFVAGSPEVILRASKEMWTSNGKVELSVDKKKEIENEMEKMLGKGLRVIACAIAEHHGKEVQEGHLPPVSFVGFVGIEDAIRTEVYDAVARAKEAGIRVVMITGDHISTARSIGKTVGIYNDGDEILTGNDLNTLSLSELSNKIVKTSIFARVTPDHKMTIIKAYENAGLIIAMTGDGVNDALSLAAADLGVAMGKAGTEVAKEASDIVLLDDNFGSIVSAVEEGRNIYKTIKKVVLYLLSTGLGEIFAIAGAIILGFEMPFSASQIIWLNFVTDGFLVVALALEPKESGILKEKMKKKDQKLLSGGMLVRMFVMGLVMMSGTLILFHFYSADFVKASTIAVTSLAMYQWFNAINCRSERKSVFKINFFGNVYLIIALLLVLGLQIIAVYNAWFNQFLGTTPIGIYEWLIIVAVSLSVIVVDEIYKFVRFNLMRV
jgi:magnesium-transporting ATPase (P-type)